MEITINHSKHQTEAIDQLFSLRESIITSHSLNFLIKDDITSFFKFFELYSCFVYDFSGYVAQLFCSLKNEKAKSFIYENLLDEVGYIKNKPNNWKNHHGELYRSLILSMRDTPFYQGLISFEDTRSLERISRDIADKFYSGHLTLLKAGNDVQSIAAFSAIEGWVSKEYELWKECIVNFNNIFNSIDIRTIQLHCECDEEHSAVLDQLIREFRQDGNQHHGIKRGLLAGITLAEQLFTDIMDNL